MAVQAATDSSTTSAASNAAPVTLSEIIEEQERIFSARQPESRRLAQLAAGSLAGGVTSSWQITAPQPVWLSHGQGSKIYDVDGNEYVDLHGGYGAGLAGHGHPAVVAAVREQVGLGTHFAQPTRAAIAVAQELSRRFGLPQWRFANSGTEATMDAVHLMRAITGRDLIIKSRSAPTTTPTSGRPGGPGPSRRAAGSRRRSWT
jgi:glutamate-1-semialdehyde 2,1-aminomutase